MQFGKLIEAVDTVVEFRRLLPQYDQAARPELFGRLLSAWIDPRAIARAARLLGDSDVPPASVTFDVGFTAAVPQLGDNDEELLLSLISESACGFRLPDAAMQVLAHLAPRLYPQERLRRLQAHSLAFDVAYLAKEERQHAEVFARIRTSSVGREVIRSPILMLCQHFTRVVTHYRQPEGDPRHSSFYEGHTPGMLEAYLDSRIADAAGIPTRAGHSLGSDDTLVVNLQFNRSIVVMSTPPLSAEFAARVRTAACSSAADEFKVK